MRIYSLHDALEYFPDLDGFWQTDDLPQTEARIEAQSATRSTVALLAQLARVQAMQGKLTEAQSSLGRAEKILTDAPQINIQDKVRLLLEQGRVTCLSMSPTRAHDFFAQAWTLASENSLPFYAVDAALMLSTIRPPKFQNEWLKKAIEIVESSDDPDVRLWHAQLLFLEGWHAFDFRQFESALQSFTKALEQPHMVDEVKRFPLEWSQARTLRALGQTSAALAIQEGLLAKMQKHGIISGHVYLELAECKQLLKSKEEAKTYFEQAYESLSANGWYSDNKVDELERMKYLYKKR
jgi:tetratricopeptide (TPR) repeat protein